MKLLPTSFHLVTFFQGCPHMSFALTGHFISVISSVRENDVIHRQQTNGQSVYIHLKTSYLQCFATSRRPGRLTVAVFEAVVLQSDGSKQVENSFMSTLLTAL